MAVREAPPAAQERNLPTRSTAFLGRLAKGRGE